MKYEIGDEVKIWTVYGHPVGTVMEIFEPTDTEPLKYAVHYLYTWNDGTKKPFTEEFESRDLALHERSSKPFGQRCTCGLHLSPSGGKHSSFCRLAGQHFEGTTHAKTGTKKDDDYSF